MAPAAAFGRKGDGRGLVEGLGEGAPGASESRSESVSAARMPHSGVSSRLRVLGAAAFAAVSMSLSGCGDTYNESNYHIIPQQQDAGEDSEPDADAADSAPDSDNADSGADADVTDAEVADSEVDSEADAEADAEECVPSLAPVSCDSSEPLAEGVLSNTSTLWAGNIEFSLDAIEMHPSGVRAIIDVKDNCGNVLKREGLLEGEIKEITIEGATYSLQVGSFHYSETDPWAFVSIGVNCYDGEECVTESGVVFQGDILLEPSGYRGVRLDDLMAVDGLAAIVSLVDMTYPEPVTIGNYVLGEGEHAMLDETVGVRVNTIAAGYSYSARWADMSFFTADCE